MRRTPSGKRRCVQRGPSSGVSSIRAKAASGFRRRVAAVVGGNPAFATTWKAKLFEYSWLRAASGQYRDFENLAGDALSYSARAHDVVLSDAGRAELAGAGQRIGAHDLETAAIALARGLTLSRTMSESSRGLLDEWIDAGRLELLRGERAVLVESDAHGAPGGPRPGSSHRD